jgi:hypothetical protein
LRLMAIRQARLERVASSAPAHERMVNGRSAASGTNRLISPQESPGSVDNEIEGPFVEIGPRSAFGNLRAGTRLPDGP